MTDTYISASADEPAAHVQATLSGRELAMRRRQAMARLGKVAAAGRAAAVSTSAAASRPAAQVAPVAVAAAAVTATASSVSTPVQNPALTKPARARREALSRLGKSALPAALQRADERRRQAAANRRVVVEGHEGGAASAPAAHFDFSGPATSAPAADIAPSSVATVSAAMTTAAAAPATEIRPAVAPTGRALAQARRAVLAKEGKAGLKRVAQAVKIAAALPQQNWQAAISQGATGRQIAMQHRLVRSLTGKSGEATPTRPAGRIRPTVAKGEAPIKVEEGHTLSGQRVTGTLVERSKLVTGNEPGSARIITGTEYIGTEQYESLGAKRPPANPSKVAVAETAKGMVVTGALVGRSPKVTGDEVGADRQLTGTPYTASAPEGNNVPEKVVVTHTARGKPVTGTFVGRGARMTGDERGLCAKVTGTEYLAAELVRAECAVEPEAGPPKVTQSTTLGRQPVTGAPLGRSAKVTGDEPGACRPITGSQYYNTDDFADLCKTPSPRRAASVMSPPQRAALATAMESALPKGVGDAGLEAACATAHPFGLDRQAMASQATVAVIPAVAVTGDRPGAGGAGTTGDERGACLPISGTPYLGEDNRPQSCPTPVSGRFLTRSPRQEAETLPPPPLDFSIISPARAAWERRTTQVTLEAQDARITGPVNKASGLVTGTPDFRHRANLVKQGEASAEHAPVGAQRLSGAGAQMARITGDAWESKPRVTGTEGASVLARNPSLRGDARGVGGVGARSFREIERVPVPESKITGSSGNTTRGALVTVSGGARA